MHRSRVSDEWYRQSKHSAIKIDEIASPKAAVYRAPVAEAQDRRQEEVEEVETTSKANNGIYRRQDKKTFFDRYVDKIKDF
jgi:cell division protein FtsA